MDYLVKIAKDADDLQFIFKKQEKKQEILTKKMKRTAVERQTNTRVVDWNVSTITDIFLDWKRVKVGENTVKTAPRDTFRRLLPEWA